MSWHLLTLFRSVPQNIIIHTDNYIQRNGTELDYPELLAGLHDLELLSASRSKLKNKV